MLITNLRCHLVHAIDGSTQPQDSLEWGFSCSCLSEWNASHSTEDSKVLQLVPFSDFARLRWGVSSDFDIP
jgi:hypothetical protein